MKIELATASDYPYIFGRDKHLLESLILPKIAVGKRLFSFGKMR